MMVVKNSHFVASPPPFRKSRHLCFTYPLAFHYSLFAPVKPRQTRSNQSAIRNPQSAIRNCRRSQTWFLVAFQLKMCFIPPRQL
jgi:hypothetical protein